MLTLAHFSTLLLFALVVSQPFFYLLALGAVSDSLSGPAYVEMRQAINREMNRRLVALYAATLVSALWLCGLAAYAGAGGLTLGTAAAIVGLAIDTVLALRRNVPINNVMDTWDTANLPAEWADYRRRWRYAFATRQAVLAAAFACLLAGTLAGRYERRSVMITSNLVFSQWDQIFKDPMTAAAAIDRLVHHATILEMSGSSVRAEQAKGDRQNYGRWRIMTVAGGEF